MLRIWIGLFAVLASRMAIAAPVDVRVGIVAYQDFAQDVDNYEQLFGALTREGDQQVRFRLAAGGYRDVLFWLDKQMIDVAILTPGAFAEVLRSEDEGRPPCQYLASRLLSPRSRAGSEPVNEDRNGYHAVCLVADSSPLRSIGDVRDAASAKRARFVFVDSLSASGWIAPMFALKQAGIGVAPEQIEYSYSHANSLRFLAGKHGEGEQVAFVWEGALDRIANMPPVRRISFPELHALTIPVDAVVARTGFEYAELVSSLLVGKRDAAGHPAFVKFPDWRGRYGALTQFADEVHLALDGDEAQSVSLDELGQMLRLYRRTQPSQRPLRLALVLSGGGAKCAYQIGAVTAIEEKLTELREETGDEDMEISLVAGTSGGAINALAIALGLSQTPGGQAELRRAWSNLDQREIVRPSLHVRLNMGLWFTAIESAVVLWFARRTVREPSRRVWRVVTVFAAMAVMQIALSYAPWKLWSWMGDRHMLHHVWLWSTFGIEWAGWGLLVIALVAAWRQKRLDRSGRSITMSGRIVTWGLTALLLGLPLAQTLTILFYERTLSDGEGIERRLLHSFTELAQFRADQLGASSLDVPAGAPAPERLQSVSRQIIDRRLLARDLVITGSCLEQSSAGAPSDLYFYAPTHPDLLRPQYGPRGVSLVERPELLLDVTMGSGSIFPVFPPRTIHGFPDSGESVELVDGGFVHNSPIEAAVRWGATHIILVEADPQQRAQRRNFLQNAAGAFNHLYYQAQLVDARAREKEPLVIFGLRPDPPHLCMLDFADNLIAAAIEKGYREARGESPGMLGRRTFRKELGIPMFWPAVDE